MKIVPVSLVAAVAAGGALGAPARYGVAQVIRSNGDGFPLATFLTNITGSLLLGAVVVVVTHRMPRRRHLRAFVAVGFLGAFTTYSTFSVEIVLLAKDGHTGVAAGYLGASVVGGVFALWAGAALARLWARRQKAVAR